MQWPKKNRTRKMMTKKKNHAARKFPTIAITFVMVRP